MLTKVLLNDSKTAISSFFSTLVAENGRRKILNIVHLIAYKINVKGQKVKVKMPVSSRGYVYRLKFLPLPFDAKRYGPPNPNPPSSPLKLRGE